MKKMNLILSGSLLVMSLGVLSPAVVYAGAETETAQEDENGEMSWVFDDCGILSDDEITELNDELATIYDTYGYVGKFLVVGYFLAYRPGRVYGKYFRLAFCLDSENELWCAGK